MHLKKITVNTRTHFFLKNGFSIDNMKPITLLVGDQGCGKSSMIDLLAKNKDIKVEFTELLKNENKPIGFYHFDFEKDNPASVTDLDLVTNIDGTPIRGGAEAVFVAKFESHGETMMYYSLTGLKQFENCVVLFDQPEAALSIRNQYELVRLSNEAVKRGCQLIFATHCLPLIESQEEVYSMEHRKWMTSKDFINSQK